jgi:hypothetical protein
MPAPTPKSGNVPVTGATSTDGPTTYIASAVAATIITTVASSL